KYDVEDLKEDLKSDFDKVKLKTSRTEPRTPAHYNAPQKEREFMNFDENEKDLFGKNEREINLDREEDDEIALPYDDGHGQGNSYLSLVLSPNLRELELMIRGLEYRKVFNQRTGKYEYKLKKIPNHPLNEYGINQIITQLKIYTSPEIKLGRKRTKDYYASVQHVAKTITRLIYKNLKSFGMDTQEKQRNAKMFCDAIIEVIDASYSRSIEGRENDLSRATDFRLEGRVDSAEDIPRALNKYRKEQAKN
ncbi:MAG: hypothetical protein ACOC4L_03305, partial [Halanaerobium sp.]